MKIILVLLTLSGLTLARHPGLQDCGDQENLADELLKKVSHKICPKDENAIENMVNREYQENFGTSPQVTKMIKGQKLGGPAKVLDLASKMLGTQPPQVWSEAAKNCETVLCAFENLFHSKTAAMEMFNIYAKSGYYLSLDQAPNANLKEQIWSAEEIQEIDAALSKTPTELRRLPNLKKIDRIADGLRRKEHDKTVAAFAMAANPAMLTFYDTGLKGLTLDRSPFETTSWPQEVMIHELCHHHDFKRYYATNFDHVTSEDPTSNFREISGWKEDVDKEGKPLWNHTENHRFVRDYAGTNPKEDYAESCMNYVLHPHFLERIDPKKYEYMKKNVFSGIEYKDKVWNDERPINWPGLSERVADESFCWPKILACTSHFEIYDNRVCYDEKREDGPYKVCGQNDLILNHSCFQEIRLNKIAEIDKELTDDPKFCELGGGRVIQQQASKICKSHIESIATAINSILNLDLKPQIKNCEEQNDFTTACITKNEMPKLKILKGFEKEIENILASSVPDRYKALATKLKTTSSKIWLQGCLNRISKIHSVTYTDKTSGVLYSSLMDKKHMSPIAENRASSPSKDCAQGMIESFKHIGHKPPDRGEIYYLMDDFFTEEFTSFENEVLSKMDEATASCILKKCKINEIKSLLTKWEQRSPKQRLGSASEEFSLQLASKLP